MKKEIEKLKGYYITDKGNVFDSNNRILKKKINACGYYYVEIGGYPFTIDRLVATAFIPNQTAILIRHKDGDKLNNYVQNLEWYYEGEYDKGTMLTQKIYKINIDGEIVETYDSLIDLKNELQIKETNLKYILYNNNYYKKYFYCFESLYSEYKIKEQINNYLIYKEVSKKIRNGIKINIIEYDTSGNEINKYKSINEVSKLKKVSYHTAYLNIKRKSLNSKTNSFFIFETITKEEAKEHILNYMNRKENKKQERKVNKDNKKEILKKDIKVRKIKDKKENSSKRRRKINEYNENGELIKVWNGIKEFISYNPEFKKPNVYEAAKGTTKRLNGYNNIIRYEDIEFNIKDLKYIDTSKPIIEYNDKGEIINTYKNAKELAKIFGLNDKTIRNVASGVVNKLRGFKTYIRYKGLPYNYYEIRNKNKSQTKEVIKEEKKIKISNNNRKIILMIDKQTNEIINQFKDYEEAMKELNLSYDSIRSYIIGRRGINKLFKLIYKEDYINKL